MFKTYIFIDDHSGVLFAHNNTDANLSQSEHVIQKARQKLAGHFGETQNPNRDSIVSETTGNI